MPSNEFHRIKLCVCERVLLCEKIVIFMLGHHLIYRTFYGNRQMIRVDLLGFE